MRDMSFSNELSELSSAMRASYSIIILFGRLIAGCAALASAATSSSA
jgi:hypothetical protein